MWGKKSDQLNEKLAGKRSGILLAAGCLKVPLHACQDFTPYDTKHCGGDKNRA